MTKLINLYGGPGTGKSTSAAYLFAKLKMLGVNAELVREAAKEWAWAGRPITPMDQFALTREQITREADLFGKVDVLVTDSPILLGAYYTRKYGSNVAYAAVHEMVANARQSAEHEGVKLLDVWLTRSKPYNPAGRYQDEAGAKQVDAELLPFAVEFGCVMFRCGTEPSNLDALAAQVMS